MIQIKKMLGILTFLSMYSTASSAQSVRHEKGPDATAEFLFAAAAGGDVERLTELLDTGMRPDVRGANLGATPLMVAASRDRLEVAEALLLYGADPNAQSDAGVTPLMWAAQGERVEMVRLLLRSGADPKARTRNGWTALDYATHHREREVARALRAWSAPRGGRWERRREQSGPFVGLSAGVGYTGAFGTSRFAGVFIGSRARDEAGAVLVQFERYSSGARRYAVGYHVVEADSGIGVPAWAVGFNLAIVRLTQNLVAAVDPWRTTYIGPELQMGVRPWKFRIGYLSPIQSSDPLSVGRFIWSIGLGL